MEILALIGLIVGIVAGIVGTVVGVPQAIEYLRKRKKGKSKIELRSQPLDTFSSEDAKRMLIEKNFHHRYHNRNGKGLRNQFKSFESQGKKLIFDKLTGLIWQKYLESDRLGYNEAQEFINQLNSKKFGGLDDWRLPTLEEAMSLMEPQKMNGKQEIFNLNKHCIKKFKVEGISEDILTALKNIRYMTVIGKTNFLDLLRSKIGFEQAEKYKSIILDCAKGLYIDEIFDSKYVKIWTVDKVNENQAWLVNYSEGDYFKGRIGQRLEAVRAVTNK